MKPRIHHLILLSCLVIVLLSAPSYSQTLTSITESDIHAMMNEMDRAARKRNVAGMIAYFAPDIKITMTVLNPGSDKEQVGTLTKDQYAFNARTNMRRAISYHFERKTTRIKIYDAQTATVTGEIYETLKFRQGIFRAASSGVMYVSLRNGKLVITAMEGRMRVY